MKPIMRNYQDENDYWCIRQFLRDVMIANNLRMFTVGASSDWITGAGTASATSSPVTH
jgi:hypothetical protein